MKRKVFGILLVGLLAVLIGAGCSKKTEQKKNTEKNILSVLTTKVGYHSIRRYLDFTGNITPKQKLKVMPDISGKIAKIYVKEGQFVKAGTVIAVLDTKFTSYQLEQAKAGLAVATANFHNAQLNWKRIRILKKKGSVSAQQFDKMQVGFEAAKAQMKQAKAGLDMAKYKMQVSKMTAPFSGFIGMKYLEEGDIVNPMIPGGMGVCDLVNTSTVKITTNVSEKNLPKIKIGQKADIHVDSYPNRVFKGRVESIVPVSDPVSRRFRVNIHAANPGFLLKAGMFAKVRILTAFKKHALSIPFDALELHGSEAYAFRVDSLQIAHKIHIKMGIANSKWVEVLSGLKEGDTVVTLGLGALQDGEKVHVSEEENQ